LSEFTDEEALDEYPGKMISDSFKNGICSNTHFINHGAKEPCTEVEHLINNARDSFQNCIETLGAMYTFEAQQPATAQSNGHTSPQ